MPTTLSYITGALVAGGCIAAGALGDSACSNVVQGNMPYLNDISNTFGNILFYTGAAAGLGAGIYEAFFSPRANPQNPGPQPPVNVRNIRIINRGGRNNFRL